MIPSIQPVAGQVTGSRPRQACSSHCNLDLDSRIGGRQYCLSSTITVRIQFGEACGWAIGTNWKTDWGWVAVWTVPKKYPVFWPAMMEGNLHFCMLNCPHIAKIPNIGWCQFILFTGQPLWTRRGGKLLGQQQCKGILIHLERLLLKCSTFGILRRHGQCTTLWTPTTESLEPTQGCSGQLQRLRKETS